MTLAALGLVLASAVFHAAWNILARRARGGLPFIWLVFALSTALYAPVALVTTLIVHPHLSVVAYGFVVGNGLLHLLYFVVLQRGYRVGDLSVVYPLARGTGPVLSSVAAIVLFNERPGPLALAGIVAVAIGIFFITAGDAMFGSFNSRLSIAYGLGTGAMIAAYTLWDKFAVSALAIAPILYDFGGNLIRTLLMTPLVAVRSGEIRAEWRDHRREIFGIAILSPAAYLLVLWVLISTPVSYVAPVREISILIGTIAGIKLFSEGYGRRRIAGACCMLAGIIALVIG